MDSVSTSELRKFGLLVGAMTVLVFAGLLPLLGGRTFPLWPFYFGIPLALFGLFFPAALRPVHFLWSRLGEALGWVNSRIILAFVFFLIFTPVAIFRRWRGKDPLGLRWNERPSSYWKNAAGDSPPRFERPF